ncbi:MAG TPA: hypothetical protein PL060_06890 [bacterium]|jgi:hypothetical protein|nr:hypothetical protein [bacterium]
MAKEHKEPDIVEIKFSKSQLVESKRFSGQKDLLNTILEDGKEYTLDEVVSRVEKYMKGKVK